MHQFNLFCFPFAGGSGYSLEGFRRLSSSFLNVIPLEYPGRGFRVREKLLTDINMVAADAFDQISCRLDKPYAIYGHSMGCLIGYLITKEIIRRQLNPPIALFFTSSAGPSVCSNKQRHSLPKDDFLLEMKRMGGSPNEFLTNNKLIEFFEPVLRADFQAAEGFLYKESKPFNTPVTVLIGLEDEISREEALAWQLETLQRVDLLQYPGNHFFIFQFENDIMTLIRNKLQLNCY